MELEERLLPSGCGRSPRKKTARGEAAKVCKWGRDSGPDRRFLQNTKIHLSPQILDLFVAILA